MQNVDLSIVIASYNTRDLALSCLDSIAKNRDNLKIEVFVSDNGSTDGTIEEVKEKFKRVKLIENRENLGFAAANNRARDLCQGKYVLILNSDTEIRKRVFKETLNYLEENAQVGALTCKIELPTGELDKDSRRSFPTPWVALTHLLYLDRLFPNSRVFSKYWYGYISPDKIHEIDVTEGAFSLVRRNVMDAVDWFDEDYFLDGEDIDLCWKIKNRGWKIVYYPKVSIVHIKKATKRVMAGKYVGRGVDSMEIFYRKRLWSKYPVFVNFLVILGIRILKILRTL